MLTRTETWFFGSCLVVLLVAAPFFWVSAATSPSDVAKEIQAQQQKLEQLKKDIAAYQNVITEKQLTASTLKKQLNILEDKIAQAELQLKANQLNLDTITLQSKQVANEIAAREKTIAERKLELQELLRELYHSDQQSLLQILVLNGSLGQFFNQINYLEGLQRNIQSRINDLQILKTELQHKQEDLATYRAKLVTAREEIEKSKNTLANDQGTKTSLLSQTRQSENRYRSLLDQAQAEQAQANRDIATLEAKARQKLAGLGAQGLDQFGDTEFIWPVTPSKGISTYFHDPEYIFRRYFEHPAIDIPKAQGSDIKASAGGYVAQAKDAGLGYSYIMLVHKGGLATVYGHVSRIDVSVGDFVAKGQIIGAVGGLPGTRGAGRLTTGAHLHFEVRQGGIPVDPLQYLP